MATNTETLTLDLKGTGKLDVDWNDVVEKVNSRPATPRCIDPEAAEVKGASPRLNSSEDNDGATAKTPRSTIRLVSKFEEGELSKILTTVHDPTLTQFSTSPSEQEKTSSHSDNRQSSKSQLGNMHPMTSSEREIDTSPREEEAPQKHNDDKSAQSASSPTADPKDDQKVTSIIKNTNTDMKQLDQSGTTTDSGLLDPVNVPLPPISTDEEQDLKDSKTSELDSNSAQKQDHKEQQDSAATPPSERVDQKTEAREKKVDKVPAPNEISETKVNERRTLGVFGTLKRKLSTNHIRSEKKESTDPLTKTTTKISSTSSKENPEHVEFKKNTPPTSPTETKKMGLFKSIRAAIKLSSKTSTKSPSAKSAKSPVTPISPVTPLSALSGKTLEKTTTKSSQRSTEKPSSNLAAKKTVKHSEKPISKQASQRQPSQPTSRPSVRQPQRPQYASLRTASTWSPPASNPVLASNPNAKMYTVWPRYPIVDVQILEVQELLESFLPNDKSAIETSREPDSQVVIHYWKAPLTAEQAEVVKGNSFISSIQLSKLDYDPSDLFC